VITKEEAITRFKEILMTKASWKTLAKSQFVSHLAIFVSWVLRESLWKIERTYQEYFLSTALNDASILAHVEDREYVPIKRTPASGAGTITNNGTAIVSLPIHQSLSSDADIDYITDRALIINPGATAIVSFIQRSDMEIIHTVTEEKAFYEIIFDSTLNSSLTADQVKKICAFDIYVDLNEGDGYEPWDYSRLFQNIDVGDHAYDEFYTHAGKYGIRFGNNYVGTILPVGALVKIALRLTDGETSLAEGQSLYVVGEVLDNGGQVADLAIVITEAIAGGAEAESISEMRLNLQYWPIYNEKLVWRDDYVFFVKRAVADILWIKVWGEEEAEAAYGPNILYINKIFISAYAKDKTSATLGAEILSALADNNILNRKFEWVAPAQSAFTVAVTGKVSRSKTISEVITAIQTILITNYGKDSTSRKEYVLEKDIYDLINGLGSFTDSGAYFTAALSGTTVPLDLNEMVSIDETISVTLTYL
jgi:hypothetical protein